MGLHLQTQHSLINVCDIPKMATVSVKLRRLPLDNTMQETCWVNSVRELLRLPVGTSAEDVRKRATGFAVENTLTIVESGIS